MSFYLLAKIVQTAFASAKIGAKVNKEGVSKRFCHYVSIRILLTHPLVCWLSVRLLNLRISIDFPQRNGEELVRSLYETPAA